MPNPFGKVQTFDIEVDAEGNEVRHRQASDTTAVLMPYAEWIKENRAAFPDKKLGLDFPTGTIIQKGDTGATKSNIGRGAEEWKHARRFERAAKEVLGLGQPSIEAVNNKVDEDSDEEPTTTLIMRFHEKRTYTPEQEANRTEGQARGRVKRAGAKVKDLKEQLEEDPDNEDLKAQLKLANARLRTHRNAYRELTGENGSK